MTDEQERLLQMLELDVDEGFDGDDLEIVSNESPDETFEVSETVIKQDEWDTAQGEELNKRLTLNNDPKALADFHSMAYHIEPELEDGKCVDRRRQQFIETMMDSPEYSQLHTSTCQNRMASEMATVQFARQFDKLTQKDKSHPPAKPGEPGDGEPDGDMLVAVSKAISDAQQEVEELEDMEAGLGGSIGGAGSKDAGTLDMDKVREGFQRLKSNRQLKAIFERAGAYRLAAKAIQKQKTVHGYDDMIGVELAGDVGRLLSCEMALLDDEDLELDILRRIVENQAMCRQYEGIESKDKGPVVVVVDESGSMSGAKIANAKGLALAMAWIARHQKRWCALVGFSGGCEGTLCVLKPGKWDQGEMMKWLEHFYSGGTDLDVPLVELPFKYWPAINPPRGKTDVIIITDAQVHAPPKMVDDFNKWKEQEKVRCISIVLGAQAGDLEKVSNEVHCIPSLTVDSDAAASCMSI